MDTKTATSTNTKSTRTPIARAAHKWYSWAGIALTFSGSYLVSNGHIRLGDASHLHAAPPSDATNVSWKPVTPSAGSEPKQIVLSPITAPTDPFKPALATETKFEPAVTGPELPDPFVASKDTKPAPVKTKASAVLDSYVSGKNIVPVTAEVPLNLPPLPEVKPVDTSKLFDLKPVVGNTPAETTKYTPVPMNPPIPAPAPVAPKSVVSPSGNGAKLLPIPPAPAPLPPLTTFKPNVSPTAPVSNQEPEMLSVPPKPIDPLQTAPKSENFVPKINKSKIINNLSREDEIKLNAVQTEIRLKNYARASALLNEIIKNNPKEFSLRAEYAGLLLQTGDTRRAIAELELVIRNSPNVAGYRLQLGDAYMSVRQYRAAASIFMGVIEMVQNEPRLSERTPEVVIRAARALALDNDLFRAAQLVDRYLVNIRPDDERAPLAYGPMLLDLDRPYDALPYLIEKRKQLLRVTTPENAEEHELKILEVLASMVRGFARVGERQQAMEAITEMANRLPHQAGIRIALADILFEINEYELGGHVYNQVLSVDPANGAALIGIARVYLETLQPAPAKRILDSFVPNAANQRGYLMTYSSYHQTVGEYTEAKQIYRDMLRRNENDHEVRYALGRVYEYTKEWEKAKAEFAKIPPQDKMSRKARLWFGMALLHQRKFAEAAQLAEQMMRDDPNNPEAVALATRANAKLGNFDRAINTGRGYLSTNPRDERSAATVRLAVGRALLDANRNLDAAREFEIALSKPAGRLPEAYYGLARSAERLGNAERAQQIVGTLTGAMGNDIRSRLLLADYYSEDYEDQKVIEIASGLQNTEGDNLAVLIRLADAQQRAARWPGNPSDCFATCQRILRQSPTNVRGHLAMARSFAITQNFRKSSVQYDQLIAIDPEFTIPPRERARVLYSDHQFSAARSQYNVMLSPTPEELVLSQMAYYSQRDQKMRGAFGPYLAGGMNGPALRAELARIATTGDDEVRLAAQRLICDYDATIAWQEPFRLERDAKELKGYRDYMAIPQYNAINTFEPTNTETLFDEGQTYGALKMTQAALTWYSNCLAVDPTHRESIAASERAGAEISPKFDQRYDWMSQRGRTGLASIDRQRLTSAVSLPLGDENEFLQLGYMRVGYFPTDDRALWGNVPFMRVQKKWDDNRLMTYGQVNVEQYQDRFSTRPTFDAGYWYDVNDVVRTRGGLFLENVAENGETLRQDIFRYGVYGGADFKPTRTWAFGGTYTYSHWSDNNDSNFGFLYNEVALSLPPKLLKLVQRFNIWNFRDQTQFPTNPPDPNNLFGAVHPYFTPNCFASAEMRVEWWHWLSRDYFVHSNQCWYSLQYGIITDNELVTYHDMKAIVNYDINSWFTVGAEGRAMISSGREYDLYSAMGFLQVRFGAR